MATNGNSNPLDRTPDMEGLSAADRARIYKERAAAAGIGRAPSPEAGGAEAAPAAAAEKPAAPRPGADGAGRGNGAPARPAAAAAGAGPAAGPAAAAPTATKPSGAGALTPEQRERLAAATQRGSAQAAGGTAPAVAEQQQRLVYVWPHLVTIELLSAMLMMLSMFVIGYILQAPLEAHANADRTPNPSKAPWYFLNLQELLLHMHPGLAGVIIPTIVLILLMAIPYIDITTDDIGVWFSGERGKRVFWISSVYTTVMTIGLIMINKYIGIRATIEGAIPFLRNAPISEIVTQTMVPTTILWVVSVGLYFLISPMRPTVRDVMIAYFTAFAVSWVLMAVIGSAFRGPGQELFWPWDMPARTA